MITLSQDLSFPWNFSLSARYVSSVRNLLDIWSDVFAHCVRSMFFKRYKSTPSRKMVKMVMLTTERWWRWWCSQPKDGDAHNQNFYKNHTRGSTYFDNKDEQNSAPLKRRKKTYGIRVFYDYNNFKLRFYNQYCFTTFQRCRTVFVMMQYAWRIDGRT